MEDLAVPGPVSHISLMCTCVPLCWITWVPAKAYQHGVRQMRQQMTKMMMMTSVPERSQCSVESVSQVQVQRCVFQLNFNPVLQLSTFQTETQWLPTLERQKEER